MNIACCQFDIAWEDKPANFERARAVLEEAGIAHGSLVLLPEMFATGFSMNVAGIAEDPKGETHQFLSQTAQDLGLYLLGGMVERIEGGKFENVAVLFDPAGYEGARYAKMHPFALSGEAEHYTPGDSPVVFPWSGFTVSPFICYDLRFPEVFRASMQMGAQLFTVIASWPASRQEHWIALLRARAIENQAYVAGVNRCGSDPTGAYLGRSLLIGPAGDILLYAGEEEGVIQAQIDIETVLDYRRAYPFLQDARAQIRFLWDRAPCD